MTRTIWLASYPKSGNTWLRVLIANASFAADEAVNINKIPNGRIASDRSSFDYAALIDSGLLTHDEVDSLRPRVYAQLARHDLDYKAVIADESRVQFVKVHDAYTLNPAGEPLLGGAQGADGAIVIVRDPRDVAPSLAHHLNCRIDQAISLMNDDDNAFYQKTNRQSVQLRQKVHGWSANIASWLDQTDIPVYLVRYEDLRGDTANTLHGTLEFAGLRVIEKQINQAIVFSEFAHLQEQEEKSGFVEAPRRGTKFFRRGKVGGWRDELTPEQVALIESRHGKMMRRLGYELSHEANLACAG
jgi:aryl sulfotransferase